MNCDADWERETYVLALEEGEAGGAVEGVALVCVRVAFPEVLREEDGEALVLGGAGVDGESKLAVVGWLACRERPERRRGRWAGWERAREGWSVGG